MGCAQSKSSRGRRKQQQRGSKVQRAAAAFEKGAAKGPTEREKEAAAEKLLLQQQLGELKTKSMKQKRKKAEQEVKACFKDKPPTGGAAPAGLRS
ncbi:hypothetical protein, conserved [Eimeria tenella]|uniref:Uncharacterized protein n=1 Tax=Eimeria tenella TaxID=5802 RepID=U6KZ47_EIMTE|nr:hypothetical protein, conserved [Eimeria tenella]CDJ41599.1 hypothetical protein, conserved [Eimeria tenella]|eukprot:XP_013232349.1 hypothetical protein, conserved [Eimeria tenella]